MSLHRQVLSGSLWTLVGNGAQQAVAFGIFLYLTRVLNAEDFGVMAIALFFLDILLTVSKLGQVETLQQQQMGTQRDKSTSFWLLQGSGWLCALLLVVLAQPMAALYHLPKLAYIMYLIAPACVLQALGSVHEAGLRSSFGFRALAFRTFLGSLAGGVVAIVAASHGYGVYALALQRLVQVTFLSATVIVSYRWLPSFTFSLADARRLATSGIHVMSATIMTLLVPRTVDLLTGYFLGPRALGIMRIAFRMFDFINQFAVTPLINVSLSSFARLRDDPPAMRNAYLRMTQLVSIVLIPAFAGLAIVSHELVVLVVGRQWIEVPPLMNILTLMSIVMPINYFFPPVMIALGYSRQVMRQSIFQLVVGIGLALVAVQISLPAVLFAHVTRVFLTSVYNLIDLRRYGELPIGRTLRRILPPLASSLVMYAVTVALRTAFYSRLPDVANLALSVATGGLVYVAAMLAGDMLGLWRGYVRDLIEVGRRTLRRSPPAAA